MRHLRVATISALMAATIGFMLTPPTTSNATPSRAVKAPSTYMRAVMADRPSAMLRAGRDITGKGKAGVAVGRPGITRLPNGDPAFVFNGRGQHVRFASRPAFQISSKRVLTVEYWMRPDALQFRNEEGSGYVYVLGKGDPGRHEWYGRMYSRSNSESRPNRISGYSFNPQGGLGAGSYFQDRVVARKWIHVVLVVNSRSSAGYRMGYTKVYKNGRLRDKDSLADYNIRPRGGSSPLRLGTGYGDSYFQGAVGNVGFYNRELPASRIMAHYRAMK